MYILKELHKTKRRHKRIVVGTGNVGDFNSYAKKLGYTKTQ